MRALLLLASLLGTAAFAQADNGGVWTGYVGGWKPTSNAFVAGGLLQASPNRWPTVGWPRLWPQPRPVVVVPSVVVMNPIPNEHQLESQRAEEQAEQRRAWDVEQARVAAQTQLEHERRLAWEREVLLQRQLEAERQLAMEREALAAEKLLIEREQAARLVAAVPAPPPPQQTPIPAKPATPGNDVYEWTDADGVVHFSTSVPASAKSTARKVGGRR
jgi:hypothetical protein